MTQHQIIKDLVKLRLRAKQILGLERRFRAWACDETKSASFREEAQEHQLQLKFMVIQLGMTAYSLCRQVDEAGLTSEALGAIGVNVAHRSTKEMARYGGSLRNVVHILKLESSATRADCREQDSRPLSLCMDFAMFHAMDTNEELGKAVHEEMNAIFGGAFGEYQQPSLSSRLAGIPA